MTAARGFIGAGEVYLNRIVGGVKAGMTGPYYASKFEVKANLKKLPLKSFARANYGQALETVSVQEPSTFSIDLSENTKDAMALGLFGTTTATSQSSGTLTAEVLVAKLGFWVPLSKKALTGTQTVTNSGVSVTYVKDIDYEVNPQMGWIRALAGGAIADAQSLKVTTTYGAFTGFKIAGATVVEVHAEIVFVGINLADRTPCVVTIHEGIIASESALNFLSDNFDAVPLPGSMVTPTDQSEPFTVETRSA